MFTLQQIAELHARLGSATTLGDYVRALHAIGVEHYDSHLTDGHSEYVGREGHTVVSPPAHEPLCIAEHSDREQFLHHLKRHGQGKTTYVEMSGGLAASGVAKWTVDTVAMTMTYCDLAGNELLVEVIGQGGRGSEAP